MVDFSAGTLALINALDYCELICSVYVGLKEEVTRTLKEKKHARSVFCAAVGMLDEGTVPPGVGVVTVMKGKHALNVLDGDLWLEAIDAALRFMEETRSQECADALRAHFVLGKKKTEAAGELSYQLFAQQYCSEFRYALVAEAAARGLVELK